MKTNEIVENNKLIGDFMEWKTPSIKIIENRNEKTTFPNGCEHNDKLKYHSSWDWLMPVVEKIRRCNSFGFKAVTIFGNGTQIKVYTIDKQIFECYPKINTEEATSLSVTHSAVVRYIEWYNNKSKEYAEYLKSSNN